MPETPSMSTEMYTFMSASCQALTGTNRRCSLRAISPAFHPTSRGGYVWSRATGGDGDAIPASAGEPRIPAGAEAGSQLTRSSRADPLRHHADGVAAGGGHRGDRGRGYRLGLGVPHWLLHRGERGAVHGRARLDVPGRRRAVLDR